MIKVNNYFQLTKPRVVIVMMLTAVVGMLLADDYSNASWQVYIFSLVGIYLCSSSAAVINHVADRHIDSKMQRTQDRPVAQGKIAPIHALIFASFLGVSGSLLLYFANIITMLLTLFSLIGYAGIYTLYLKRATSQNIVIGGLAGSLPPLLGWTAVAGGIHPNALALCLIIFLWTPPHFWALAIARRDEYAKANIPMLPITHGVFYTKIYMLIYTALMIFATILPYALGMFKLFYLVTVLLLGAIFIYYVVLLFYKDDKKYGMACFWYSVIYLMLLFIAMFIDRMI